MKSIILDIDLFDCNCCFGNMPRPPFRYSRTTSELLSEMDFCGIKKSLVYHSGMRFSSPAMWNNKLIEDVVGKQARIYPTWTILNGQTHEMPQPEVLIKRMIKNGVRALRAFPQEHHYQLNGLSFGDLLNVLIENCVPLFVKETASNLGGLLREFPNLKVVAVNQGPHSLERYLRPLLDAFQNLYLETSYYIIQGTIEEFCERYGPERLLFGSGYPDNCYGGSVLQLLNAAISKDAKKAIASGNLERLLAWADKQTS